ncbi:MAG TPA: cytochrome c3 family protein [Steroidobacteraceae bacterium]|nr:cytochrome c3 family protein [Steroidobacteraceae bacterium]
MRIPEQVRRLGLVIAVLVAVVVLLRFVVLPSSLFSARPHQIATVGREMDEPLQHAGAAACRKCHADEFDTKYAGKHRGVACENCHGPAIDHASDAGATLPPKPVEREACLDCHGYDASRPDGFPQVDPQEHNPRRRCIVCHDPHEPSPPRPPQDCGGCHGRIEHIKSLSTHALVACKECHTVDEQHMIEPRTALPTKPASREVCGRCHAAGSDAPEVTSAVIDLDSHGGRYVCWHCHYAHLPEGRK